MKSLITVFDLLLIVAAIWIMWFGMAKRWQLWRAKKKKSATGNGSGLITYLLKHTEVLKRPWVGTAHIVLFWGILIPLAVILVAQFGFTIPQVPARLLSLVQELAGITMLAGTLFFFIRRLQSSDKEGPRQILWPLGLLLIILISGFLAGGARLSIIPPSDNMEAWTSPFGYLLSKGLPASPLFMQLMIRLHFFGVLLFIAVIPFTYMRHLVASPLNVYYRKQGPRAALTPVSLEKEQVGARTVNDFSWKQLLEADACVACGRCSENCPATLSEKPLSPRNVMRSIVEQVEDSARHRKKNGHAQRLPLLENAIKDDEIWACTTCMACVEHCPVFVEPLDKIIDMRRHLVMGKACLPTEAQPMFRNLELFGDVLGKGIAHRGDWAMNRNIPHMAEAADAEVLLWVGCSGAFHPRNQETSRAMAQILKAAGIAFGILAKDEVCCGDPARRLGDETLFLELAQKNIAAFQQYGIKKIITLCPHCLNTLKNEYPALGCEIEVVHATEYVMKLIQNKQITLKYPVANKLAIHDACYLGRYNQVYEPPRDILGALPDAQLKELDRSREKGFCCGGGGGRMWLHENIGRNINHLRSEEVVNTDIDLIGTTCPYCLVMLDDGIKSFEKEKLPKVADVIDIVAASMG